jgi:hypothetical protein
MWHGRNLLYWTALVLWIGGCGSVPESGSTGRVVYFEIDKSIRPEAANARVGDEIRWQNTGQRPVKLGLLNTISRQDLRCAKGFIHFGVVQDFVTIPAGQYASLCLSHPGSLQFNVWFDPESPRSAISPLGTVRVSEHAG